MASFDMTKLRVPLTGLILLLASGLVMAQFHRKIRSEEQAPVAPPVFDHYVLELGWAPNFCAQPDAAAGAPRRMRPRPRDWALVVHGFQPEAGDGKSLSGCGPAKTVPKPVVNMVLRYMLSPTRIQSAWAAEGICTGLKPGEYFGNIRKPAPAYRSPCN